MVPEPNKPPPTERKEAPLRKNENEAARVGNDDAPKERRHEDVDRFGRVEEVVFDLPEEPLVPHLEEQNAMADSR